MVNFKDIYIYIHQRQEQRHVAGWQFTIVQWQIIRTISFLSHGIGLPPVFSLVKWVMTVSWDETIDLSPANFFSSLFLRRIEIAAIEEHVEIYHRRQRYEILSPPTAPQLFPIPLFNLRSTKNYHTSLPILRYYSLEYEFALEKKKERILFSYPILHTLSRGPLKNLVSPNFGYFLWINLYSFSLYYYSILSRDRKQSGMAERGRGAVFTSSFRDEIFSLLRYFINCPVWKCRDPKFMRPACRNAADDKSFRRNVLAFLLAW